MDILTPSYRSGKRSAPMAILCSLILDLSACLSSGWLLGHFGDVVVLRLSPAACCSLKCLRCQDSKPFFSCSGNSQLSSLESNESSLDVYALSNHLQYWTIAFLGLGFLSCSLFICDDVSRILKVRDKEKTSLTMIKMAVITCLAASMLSSIVQAIITYESLDPKRLSSSFSDLNTPTSAALEVGDLVVTFGWPYYARCISILLVCCVALPLVISRLCSRKSLVLLMATKNPHAGFSSDNECGARSAGVAVCQHKRSSTDPLSSTSHSSTSPRSNSSVVSSLVGTERLEPFLVLTPRNREGDLNAGQPSEAVVECCLDESLGASYGKLAVSLCGDGGSHSLIAGRALEQYRAIVCYESACGEALECSQRLFNTSLTKCSCIDQGGPSDPYDLKPAAEGQKFNRLTSVISHVRGDCTGVHDDRLASADQYEASSKSFTRAMRKQLSVPNGSSTSTTLNSAPTPIKVNGVKFTQLCDSHEMMSLENNDVTLVNE